MKRLLTLAVATALVATSFGVASAQPYPGPGAGPPPGPPPGFHPPSPGFHPPPPGAQPPPPGFRPGPPPPWGGPAPAGWRHWNRGDRFYGPRYMIRNWGAYALPRPWPGYSWARSGGEFVMINLGNGVVGNVVINPSYP